MKRLLPLAIFLFLITSQYTLAEITSPYTLDEKTQVLFGDSALISATSTYQGLENYTHEYVGNYLHITFTYTHSRLSFSDYPPRLYITTSDPRATTSPIVKDQQIIYQLMPIPVPPGHETDWYLYDVQFDSTGYTVVVKEAGDIEVTHFHQNIAGQTDNDWVALANLYPNSGNPFSMAFTPLTIYNAPPPPLPQTPIATTTPVIVVPGISSSFLIRGGNPNLEVWINVPQMLLSITDSYLEDLRLSPTGEKPNDISLTANKIIRETGNNDFFTGLFSNLDSHGYTENTDLFEFPYDWRLDVATSAIELKNKIDAIKLQTGVDNVDLVAHSMGGLVVKKYLKDYGGDSIEKFIDIGTPHTGAAKAFKILNYGDNFDASFLFGLFGLNAGRVKSISQNMPSVYELLPSRNYFNDYPYYVFNSANGSDRLSFEQTGSYLKTSGRNGALVDRADTFHQEIDGLNPADFGVETYNIVGCGMPTIGQFYVLDETVDHPIYNIRMISGDGTVPLKSAEAISASSTYYVQGIAHALLPSTSGVKELVSSLVSTTTPFDISPYSNLSTTASGCEMPNGKIVSFHSPIDLHIYDSFGHHTGPDINGDIENGIDEVVYEILDDNKFAYLPDGMDYTVRGSATSAGTFDVRIQEVVNGEVSTTTLFANLPLSQNTQSTFAIGSTTPSQVHLDNNNDGAFEIAYNNSSVTSGVLESSGKVKPKAIETSIKRTNTGTIRSEIQTNIVSIATTTSPNSTTSLKKLVSSPVSTNKTTKVEVVATNTKSFTNTAVVSKSLESKLKSPLKKLWSWFKKKL